ncbi:MAG: exonuclease [Gloeocapsa sp. DLM2.Bin57]|nr:MAG: exonuclease [Gloeocapsa sp. DLM2.Bin57]
MLLSPNFLVIDTEGKQEINEIAIINKNGRLIYEAYNKSTFGVKSIAEIVEDIKEIIPNHLLVFHSAQHDLQILSQSFKQVGQSFPKVKTDCTYQLAKRYFPRLDSYSLQYLSQYLDLRVNGRVFNLNLAHSAKYDAQFTYQLYQKIREKMFQNTLNPFSSNRVDTPFQQHPDYSQIYQEEFNTLTSILTDIKLEPNHQSKGAIIIGEPGSGKTHLIMRLAQKTLATNRLLFIRQPNNAKSILFHIYTRILESLVEPVPKTNYSQLEYFLAKTFVNFMRLEKHCTTPTKLNLLTELEADPFSIYDKRKNFPKIEKYLTNWWSKKHGGSGYSLNIIKGIVKYCSYVDKNYKILVTRWLAADELKDAELKRLGLDKWSQELSQENFALEAISVLGKLSLLDEPLIIVFDQLESLSLPYNQEILLSFGEAIKDICTHVPNSLIILNLFPDRWSHFQEFFDPSVIDRISQSIINLSPINPEQLQQILKIKLASTGITLTEIFTTEDIQDILQQNSIRKTINRAADYYRYRVHGITLPQNNQTQLDFKPIKTYEERLNQLETELHQIKLQLAQLLDTEAVVTIPETIPLINKTEDHILLNYWETEKEILSQDYNNIKIIDDSDEIGKLRQIATAFLKRYSGKITVLRLRKLVIPENLVISHGKQENVLAFLNENGSRFTPRMKNFNQLLVNHPHLQFILIRDRRQPAINGKVGLREITNFTQSSNAELIILEKEARIEFELMYKMITDINNRDLEIDLKTAIDIWVKYYHNSWLVKKMLGQVK